MDMPVWKITTAPLYTLLKDILLLQQDLLCSMFVNYQQGLFLIKFYGVNSMNEVVKINKAGIVDQTNIRVEIYPMADLKASSYSFTIDTTNSIASSSIESKSKLIGDWYQAAQELYDMIKPMHIKCRFHEPWSLPPVRIKDLVNPRNLGYINIIKSIFGRTIYFGNTSVKIMFNVNKSTRVKYHSFGVNYDAILNDDGTAPIKNMPYVLESFIRAFIESIN